MSQHKVWKNMFDTIYRQMLKKSPTGRTSSHGTNAKKQFATT
nr:MAG TPA: hypothetical protein [Caudoviricetes sp.]